MAREPFEWPKNCTMYDATFSALERPIQISHGHFVNDLKTNWKKYYIFLIQIMLTIRIKFKIIFHPYLSLTGFDICDYRHHNIDSWNREVELVILEKHLVNY